MLFTITTTYHPATDLGYLLHKHPANCQTFSVSFGKAHVFFPQAEEKQCTAALLLDVDPVGLVRGQGKNRKTGFIRIDYPRNSKTELSYGMALSLIKMPA